MLQATHDIRKVALWLGHADVRTTEIYLRHYPSEKLEAAEAVAEAVLVYATRPVEPKICLSDPAD
jgi:integrase